MIYELNSKTHIGKGKVQGVFFRKSAKQIAADLNISGWVKNTHEGHVEIFAQGDSNALYQLIKWCEQGPPKAKVEDVEVKDAAPDYGIKNFYLEY